MKKLLIIAGIAGAIYYWSKRQAQAEPRRLGPRRVGEIEVPEDADPTIVTLQDQINLSEAWIMQAAGDIAASQVGQPLPGGWPEVDWFGGECQYTGHLDPATRLHLTRIKQVLWKTHLPAVVYEQLGLARLMGTDVGIENDPEALVDAMSPLEMALMAIGGEGYPAVTDANRIYWSFYEAIGNAYLTLVDIQRQQRS